MTTNKSDFQQLHYIANKILKYSSIYRSDGVRYSASTESSDRRVLAPKNIGAHRYSLLKSLALIKTAPNYTPLNNKIRIVLIPLQFTPKYIGADFEMPSVYNKLN